jgi:hypothetical protein
MKKIARFILLTVVVIMLLILKAQSQITITPKAGLVMSSMKFDDADIQEEIKAKPGFTIGVGISKSLSGEMLNIQAELNFIKKGLTASPDEGLAGYDEEWLISPSYLEVPVMLRYAFGGGPFFIEGGLSMGILLGGKATIEGDELYGSGYAYETDDLKITVDASDDELGDDDEFYFSSGTDLGVQLGFGAKLGKVVLGVRYGVGLTKVINKDDFDFVGSNRAWQFTLGYPIAK